MYKAIFQNSKVALLFVVITVMSAVSMVGTSDNGGLVLRLTTLIAGQRATSGSAGGAVPATQPPPPSVFGDYQPQSADSAPVSGSGTGTGTGTGGQGFNPMTAPPAPGSVVQQGGAISAGGPIPESELAIPTE
ncbi:MAG: hypothetical protein KAF27_11090 [Porphyrobacter sp.]|nr:hypothetical protein [Porphyrobacter sp.]